MQADIACRTPLLPALRAAMAEDPRLGVVAPSRLVIDDATNATRLVVRPQWDLDRGDFQAPAEDAPAGATRIEADYADPACMLIRLDAVEAFDEAYDSDLAAADLGFRLWQAGYGCATLPGTQIGPITTRPQFEKILSFIRTAKEEGARCVLGGNSRPDLGPGLFIEPTILTNIRNQMRIAQEEVFGPVLAVIPFDDEQEATGRGLVGGHGDRRQPRRCGG